MEYRLCGANGPSSDCGDSLLAAVRRRTPTPSRCSGAARDLPLRDVGDRRTVHHDVGALEPVERGRVGDVGLHELEPLGMRAEEPLDVPSRRVAIERDDLAAEP
jgi:hypothetical protein